VQGERVKRPRHSAPRSRSRFPRLHAAWATLLAAGVAHADATVPPKGDKKQPCPSKQPSKDAPNTPRKPDKREQPDLDGVVGSLARPPRAPAFIAGDAGLMLIHPHGPDEPCVKRKA
jgi:hypothetical protein